MRGAPQGWVVSDHAEDWTANFLGGRSSSNRSTGLETDFQYRRNPALCQRTTVSGVTKMSDCLQPDHRHRATTQKSRSKFPRLGRGWHRLNTANCRRNVKFSRRRFCRERKRQTSVAMPSLACRNMAGRYSSEGADAYNLLQNHFSRQGRNPATYAELSCVNIVRLAAGTSWSACMKYFRCTDCPFFRSPLRLLSRKVCTTKLPGLPGSTIDFADARAYLKRGVGPRVV